MFEGSTVSGITIDKCYGKEAPTNSKTYEPILDGRSRDLGLQSRTSTNPFSKEICGKNPKM